MSLRWREFGHPLPLKKALSSGIMTALVAAVVVSCGGDSTSPSNPQIKIGSIVVDGGSREVERGSISTVTATVHDSAGKVITIPVAWLSSVDSIIKFGPNGEMIAGDTGTAAIAASALGVASAPVAVHVAWRGAAAAAAFHFAPPLAISPSASLGDSVRVAVTTLDGNAAVGARVSFTVTAGGGTLSPAAPTLVTVGTSGIAAAKWILGPSAGTNSVMATVVGGDSLLINWVKGNPVVLTVKSFAALTAVQGDAQTAGILSTLPIAPSIKLVDSTGAPRAGIPITFTATSNGRVANTVASTSVNGVASPGVWTLGDVTGDQQLIVTVEAAKLILHATATGAAVRLGATQVATSQTATCALTADTFVSCLGAPPFIGTGDTTKSLSTPTVTKGGIQFSSITGGSSHFCGTTPTLAIYCWGANALVDTINAFAPGSANPIATFQPTRLQSNVAWTQVTAGAQHNCALDSEHAAFCWGLDTTGQLGDNLTTRHLAPQRVAGGFKFATLAAGSSHECAIDLDGAAFCWGLNSSAQIGDGTTTTRLAPTAVSGTHKWTAIGAGAAWSCGLADGGAPLCWGGGTGKVVPTVYAGAPVFTRLSVGAAHACALTGDGTAYCWGDNSGGQLGDSTVTSRDVPQPVTTTIRFASISAGIQHTCGVSTDGFVACWGRNQSGELGFDTPSLQLTPRFIVLGVKP